LLGPRGAGGGGNAALPLPLAREVEAAYQPFASAWRAGRRPPIEDHLAALPGPARSLLLPELLELELFCRRWAGEAVRPEEYRNLAGRAPWSGHLGTPPTPQPPGVVMRSQRRRRG
jgi:hypothetical protein